MSPDSVVALVMFLVILAPGLLYELVAERKRPAHDATTFREASRVALFSCVFTGAALLLLVPAVWKFPGVFPDFDRLLVDGYLATVLPVSLRAMAMLFALSCTISYISARLLTRKSPGNIKQASIWWKVFRDERPLGKVPWVHLSLKDESEVIGFLVSYTPEQALENREICLGQPDLKVKKKGGEWKAQTSWKSIVVRGSEISRMQITYQDDVATGGGAGRDYTVGWRDLLIVALIVLIAAVLWIRR